uniref:Uncharacterized protein n=1 Tax=Plectus sambesii TaxID=2011161 RepID=A0A914WFI9_9BILA
MHMLPRICLCVLCTFLIAAATAANTTLSVPTTTDGTLQISPSMNITSNNTLLALDRSSNSEAKEKKLARKALRRKKKRLRKLREKVRMLRAELFQEGNDEAVAGDDGASALKSISTLSPLKKAQQQPGGRLRDDDLNDKKSNVRWRKRIMKQLAQVIRRLDRLESYSDDQQEKKTTLDQSSSTTSQRPPTNQKLSKKERREDRKRRRQQMRLRKFIDKGNGKPASAPSGRKKKRLRFDVTTLYNPGSKLDKLHSSINQSLSGDQGGSCVGHRDCRPGLCCHSSTTNNGTVKFCVLHGFLNGVRCDDSCQCSSGLHCFKVANDPAPADLQLPQSLTERPPRGARCKKASTEDVLHGVYLNAKDGAFSTLPFPQ